MKLTTDIVADALTRASAMLRDNPDWDLARSLAEATTTDRCNGVSGYLVFAAVREAVTECLSKGATLGDHRTPQQSADLLLLAKCRLVTV